MSYMEKINPLNHMSQDKYVDLWQYLFANMLQGFWGRFFAFALLGLSIWFSVRRRNFQLSAVFFLLATLIAFGAPLLRATGLM